MSYPPCSVHRQTPTSCPPCSVHQQTPTSCPPCSALPWWTTKLVRLRGRPRLSRSIPRPPAPGRTRIQRHRARQDARQTHVKSSWASLPLILKVYLTQIPRMVSSRVQAQALSGKKYVCL